VTQPQTPPPEKSVAQVLSEMPELLDGLYLVQHGVPFDVAFSLDEDMRLAFCVIIGELNGGHFNWTTRTWDPPRTR